MSIESVRNNTASHQSIVGYGLNGIRHVVEGALKGLNYGVRTVCRLPIAAFNGVIERCQEKGVARVAIEVGEVCLGGAVFVELNRIRTQLESRSLWQSFQGLAFAFLAIQTYRYSGQAKALTEKVNKLLDQPLRTSTPVDMRLTDSPVVIGTGGEEIPKDATEVGLLGRFNTSFRNAMERSLGLSFWWDGSN